MIRVVVGLLAVACVFAGWANLPRVSDPSSGAAGVLLGGVVVAAFVLGRRSISAEATAIAMASARATAASAAHAGATAHSQVVVVTGAEGARQVAESMHGRPEWIGDRQVDVVEQLVGSDAVESMLDDLEEVRRHEA